MSEYGRLSQNFNETPEHVGGELCHKGQGMVRYVEDIPFPGPNPPLVDATKLKNIIFCAMPPAWQTNFLCVNNVSTTSVLQLQQFMAQE
jgi:hypothetical protein